jgi:hypothetical protein
MIEVSLYNSVSSDYYINSDVIPGSPSPRQLNTTGASVNTVFQWSVNISVNLSDVSAGDATNFNNWWALLALVLVLGTAAGNILVCLAITWERRLQNVTNYFLMSLAITDLMVAVLVMPLGILTLVRGKLVSAGTLQVVPKSKTKDANGIVKMGNTPVRPKRNCVRELESSGM